MKRVWILNSLAALSLLLLPIANTSAEEGERGKGGGDEREVRKEGKGDKEEKPGEDVRRPPPPRREGEVRDGEQPRREGDQPREQPRDQPRREGEDRREPRPPGPPDGRPAPGTREGDFRGPPGPPLGQPRDGRPGESRPQPPHELERMKEHDPDMYELMQKDMDLERKAFELSNAARRGSQQDREKLREEAKELATQHFMVRQDRRKLQLKRMETELVKLRESIESREKQREEIISRRLAELLGEESDLGF
jgi:hypothetical protein